MKKPCRRAAATVEFAVVVPVFFLLVFGLVEFGRAIMVAETVNNAARAGCRTGALLGRTNSDVQAAVNTVLNGAGLPDCTPTVEVNGDSTINASTAVAGDSIGVTVTANYDQVSWLPLNRFLNGVTLKSKVVMRRE